MPITCDRCGKEATIANKPEDKHFFEWMMDESHGDNSMVALPHGDSILCVCFSCVAEEVAAYNASAKVPDEV